MNQTTDRVPRGISLHIGVKRCDPAAYDGKWDGPVPAAENDVDTMEAIARKQGFVTTTLKTREATRENVAQAFRSAAAELNAGDIFLVTYSGHGDYVKDLGGDEEDGYDETWCLYNGHFLDDELNVELAGFKPGCRVLVLSDSCHSGTMTKSGKKAVDTVQRVQDDFVYSREIPKVVSLASFERHRDYYSFLQLSLPRPRPRISASVRLLSGCQEDELSYGNSEGGRFTQAVKTVFADGAFEGGYLHFHAAIIKALSTAMNPQTPAHSIVGVRDRNFDNQKPFTI